MTRSKWRRPSPATVIAVIALAAASGGSAVAEDAVESVKRKFISGGKIKPRSLAGNRVKKNALGGTEINESRLGKVPSARNADSATNAINASNATNATNASNAIHAGTADTATNASAVNGVTQAEFTVGRSASGSCDPSSATFVDCTSVTFSLPRSGRVLLIADTTWHSNSSAATRGSCEIAVDGTGESDDVFPGQFSNNTTLTPLRQQSVGANLVTSALNSGSHTFAFRCNQLENDIVYDQAFLSAVMIGSA